MSEVRLKPKFITGYRQSLGFVGVCFFVAALALAYVESGRAGFVTDHTETTCTVASRSMGKTSSLELRCDDHFPREESTVGQSVYDENPVGTQFPIFYAKNAPQIWERFAPTATWSQARAKQEWFILAGVAAVAAMIFRAIWRAGQGELAFLRHAELLDAEIVDVANVDTRQNRATLRVKFRLDGEWKELSFDGGTGDLGQYYTDRQIRVAVQDGQPIEIRALNKMNFAEPCPKVPSDTSIESPSG
ncbi:MAG: hypothetical protein JST51_14190 [Armatimonadetes bacterium]|nr:hypothetical protein [Armatimonadota bacterium]